MKANTEIIRPKTSFDAESQFGSRVDIHTHLLPGRLDAEQRMEANAYLGVSHCIVLSTPAGSTSSMMSFPPEQAYSVAQQFPQTFSWWCNVVPDGTDKTYHQLLRYKEMGAKGVGEFAVGIEFDSPLMEHFLSCLEELEMPLLFHMAPEKSPEYYGVIDAPRLPGLEKALRHHPNLIIIGHSQPFWFEISRTEETDPHIRNSFPQGKVEHGRIEELMRTYPNLYCDMSANSGGGAMMRDPEYALEFMTEFQDRLFYGSDWCGGPLRYGFGPWLDSLLGAKYLDATVYHKICSINAKKIFRL